MESNIVRVNFKEKKKHSERTLENYARQASEVASQYLNQLEKETGEPLSTAEMSFEGVAERLTGKCPHCDCAYEARSKKWVVLKSRVLRVSRGSNRVQIKCRACKRWVRVPFLFASRCAFCI